ncbi:MAG: hypothetical protein GY822_14065 [Deltaproteobacteria bacterium]|nr:hypothetical protein [Deltaproteobacteria bacterium]
MRNKKSRAENRYCELGVCRKQRCTPSSSSCQDNHKVVCDDVGSSQTIVSCLDENECTSPNGCQCTALGETLEAGVACVERNCIPGQKQCAEDGVRTCLDDGSAFGEVQVCEQNTACTAGRCLPTPCIAGQSTCAQDVLLLCDDVAQYTEQDCSAAKAFCQQAPSSDEAHCETRICEPGTRSCSVDGLSEQHCDERGSAQVETACGVDETCQQGLCSAKICTADTTRSEGNTVVMCDANGQEESIDECVSGSQCDAGVCVTIAPLTVELTWSHPSANLDLVFAQGQICDENRVDWAQVHPNWGFPGNSDEDPFLDIVDDDGLGPEHLLWAAPQPGQYFLGIHFYGPESAHTVASLQIKQGDVQLMCRTIPMGEKDLFVEPVTVLQHDVIVDLSLLRLHGDFNGCREDCEHCTDDESCPVEVGECLATPLSALYCEQDSDCDGNDVCFGTCTPPL